MRIECPHWKPAVDAKDLSEWDCTLGELLHYKSGHDQHGLCAWLATANHLSSHYVTENTCKACLEAQKTQPLDKIHEKTIGDILRQNGTICLRHLQVMYQNWSTRAAQIKANYEQKVAELKILAPEMTQNPAIEKEIQILQLSIEEETQVDKFKKRVEMLALGHKDIFARLAQAGAMEPVQQYLTQAVQNGKLPLELVEIYVKTAFPSEAQ